MAPDYAYRQFTWLIEEAGEQLHVVAERLGHADSSSTSTIHAHVTKKQHRGVVETDERIVEVLLLSALNGLF